MALLERIPSRPETVPDRRWATGGRLEGDGAASKTRTTNSVAARIDWRPRRRLAGPGANRGRRRLLRDRHGLRRGRGRRGPSDGAGAAAPADLPAREGARPDRAAGPDRDRPRSRHAGDARGHRVDRGPKALGVARLDGCRIRGLGHRLLRLAMGLRRLADVALRLGPAVPDPGAVDRASRRADPDQRLPDRLWADGRRTVSGRPRSRDWPPPYPRRASSAAPSWS